MGPGIRPERTNSQEATEEGAAEFARYLALRAKLDEIEAAIDNLGRGIPAWKPMEEKTALIEAFDMEADIKRALEQTSSAVIVNLTQALELEPRNVAARETLADYYWQRLMEAEDTEDSENVEFYAALVEAHDQGKYQQNLAGDGGLEIDSQPAGAEVWISELSQVGLLRAETNSRLIGKTPLRRIPLPMGSYMVRLNHPGFRETYYPVFISRNREWRGTVRLCSDREIGEGFIYIPAGPTIQGGDKKGTHGWALPKREIWVNDFFIARHPVTMAEYVEFLNDVARETPGEAQQRAPRRSPVSGYYLTPAADGKYHLEEDSQAWNPLIPALSISWFDAEAYCQWFSAQNGRTYRLPTEEEWEKAARGVDGSYLPWGNRFDPCLCNMRDSRQQGPGPVKIDEFPTDVSVYGVRGMAGNVRDWTLTQVNDGQGMAAELGFQRWVDAKDTRVVKGGAWSPLRPRLADRYWLPPTLVLGFVGFRMVCEPSD